MCSIMGYLGKSLTKDEFREHFDRTISRGPDMQRIIDIPGGIMGFERLSIMGLSEEGMQPFNLNSNFIVCNGYSRTWCKIARKTDIVNCRYGKEGII